MTIFFWEHISSFDLFRVPKRSETSGGNDFSWPRYLLRIEFRVDRACKRRIGQNLMGYKNIQSAQREMAWRSGDLTHLRSILLVEASVSIIISQNSHISLLGDRWTYRVCTHWILRYPIVRSLRGLRFSKSSTLNQIEFPAFTHSRKLFSTASPLYVFPSAFPLL